MSQRRDADSENLERGERPPAGEVDIAEAIEQQEQRTARIERRLATLEAQERELMRLRESLAYSVWREQRRLASRPYRVYDAMVAAANAPKDLAVSFRDAVMPSARARSARPPAVVVVLAGLSPDASTEVVTRVTIAAYTRRTCSPVFVVAEDARQTYSDVLISMGARFEFVRTNTAIDVARFVDERDPTAVIWPAGEARADATQIDRIIDEVLDARARRRRAR